MLVMTTQTPKPSEPERKSWLKRLDRSTAAHEKTRRTLEGDVADARAAGIPLTAISEHTPYSREWVRKIAARVEKERAETSKPSGPSAP